MIGTVTVKRQDEISLSGIVIPSVTLSASISNNERSLSGHVTVSTEYDTYSGDYDVVPQIESQILNTSDKLMSKDMTIKAIPYYSVSNEYDGETIIIGGNN